MTTKGMSEEAIRYCRSYAIQANDPELELWSAEIKVRAHRLQRYQIRSQNEDLEFWESEGVGGASSPSHTVS